jgi:aminocarboxymuconate-semialdehyde decarboxylase
MDSHGIDIAVVSFGALDVSWAGARAPRLAHDVNAGLAAMCKAAHGRLRFLASVPAAAEEHVKSELEHALALGAVGACVTTTIGGRPLDAPDLRPFWSITSELRLPVFVHPCYPTSGPANDDGTFLLAGFLGETTLAATRFAMSGMATRYPGVRVIWSHVGGALPMFVERLESAAARFPASGGSPAAALAGCWFDTVCTHGPALDCAQATFGASRLLFGTDEPHQLEKATEIVDAITSRAWTTTECEAVLGDNAARLFGIVESPPRQ